MRKIACLFMVLCLTVMLAACGGKADGSGSAQTPSAERDSKTGISAEPLTRKILFLNGRVRETGRYGF